MMITHYIQGDQVSMKILGLIHEKKKGGYFCVLLFETLYPRFENL
jgi:hypothetical protein